MLPGIGAILAGGTANDNIVFVGGKIQNAGATTIAINSGLTGGIASSASSGDFVLAAIVEGASVDSTLSITDGTNPYTLLGSELHVGTTLETNLRAAYKFITADTTVTFGTDTDIDGTVTAVLVFRGVNTVTPIDTTVQTATGTNGDADPPSITPASQNCFLVAIGAGSQLVESIPTYTAAYLTNFFAAKYNSATLGLGYIPSHPIGAYDPAAFTGNDTSSWAAMTIALRSA